MSTTVPRRRPRWILGTWWLMIGVIGIGVSISAGNIAEFFIAALCLAYSVYLYRGGRFGFIVW